MKMKTTVLLTLGALVLASLAVPAMAQPEDRGRPDEAGRPDHAARDANATDNRSRGPPGHVMERAESRCDAVENETGRRPAACDRLAQIHDGSHQARRAAHALMNAIEALEHRLEKLDELEARFEAKLAQDNLTENQTAAWEAKIERVHAAQNQTLERIEAMQARLDGLKDKWDAVREHAQGRMRIEVCHIDEEGSHTIHVSRAAWPAHERHGDGLGACAGGDVAPESDDASDDTGDDSDGGSDGSDDSDDADDDADDETAEP